MPELLALTTLIATTLCQAADHVDAPGEERNTEPPVQRAGRKCLRNVKVERPAQRGSMAAAASSQPTLDVESDARTNEGPSTMLTPADLSNQRRSLERLLELQTALEAAEHADPGGPTVRQLQSRIWGQLGLALGVVRKLGERFQMSQAATASVLVPDLLVLTVSGEELITIPRTTAPMKLLDIEQDVVSVLNLSFAHQRLEFLGPGGATLDAWVEHHVESVMAVVVPIPQVEVFRTAEACVTVDLPDALWVLPAAGTSEDVLGTCDPHRSSDRCRGRAVGAHAIRTDTRCAAVLATDDDLRVWARAQMLPARLARRQHRCASLTRYEITGVASVDLREALDGVAGGEVSEDVFSLYSSELTTLGYI